MTYLPSDGSSDATTPPGSRALSGPLDIRTRWACSTYISSCEIFVENQISRATPCICPDPMGNFRRMMEICRGTGPTLRPPSFFGDSRKEVFVRNLGIREVREEIPKLYTGKIFNCHLPMFSIIHEKDYTSNVYVAFLWFFELQNQWPNTFG